MINAELGRRNFYLNLSESYSKWGGAGKCNDKRAIHGKLNHKKQDISLENAYVKHS